MNISPGIIAMYVALVWFVGSVAAATLWGIVVPAWHRARHGKRSDWEQAA